MSHAMDKAMMALSLDEDDQPFVLPNLPQFQSCERNAKSIIGRLLNPDCQNMADLILNMPRKWQKLGKIRGVALSKERFQFIFDHEHDLVEVLEKGIHTHNEWALAIDRWVEYPPEDYLQFVDIWVQIRNIPVNNYTAEAIMAFGEILGEVKLVAFDPDKPQVHDYVRVLVRFNVSKPLRKTKVVDLREGGSTVLHFNYERVQKRCYECQRLNHEKDVCPLLIRKRKDEAIQTRQRITQEKKAAESFLKPDDPLFGILSEEQVGICPNSGKRKITTEVLEEMRRYMLMATEEDKLVRIDRIQSSVAEVEKDPVLQKTVLRLEPAPMFTKQLDKGKGRVFDLDLNISLESKSMEKRNEGKLLASSMQALRERPLQQFRHPHQASMSPFKGLTNPKDSVSSSSADALVFTGRNQVPEPLVFNPTEHDTGYSITKTSGVNKKSAKPRRRPYVKKRKGNQNETLSAIQELYGPTVDGAQCGVKRKGSSGEEEDVFEAGRKESRVIPREGLPRLR